MVMSTLKLLNRLLIRPTAGDLADGVHYHTGLGLEWGHLNRGCRGYVLNLTANEILWQGSHGVLLIPWLAFYYLGGECFRI